MNHKFKIYLSLIILLFVIFLTLVFVEINQNELVYASFLNGQYYLYLKDEVSPVFYILNHQTYLVNKLVLIESNWYLVNLKFDETIQPVFFQIQKSISLITYLFTAIFKI